MTVDFCHNNQHFLVSTVLYWSYVYVTTSVFTNYSRTIIVFTTSCRVTDAAALHCKIKKWLQKQYRGRCEQSDACHISWCPSSKIPLICLIFWQTAVLSQFFHPNFCEMYHQISGAFRLHQSCVKCVFSIQPSHLPSPVNTCKGVNSCLLRILLHN